MMIYPLVYRLLAETPEEKERVYRLIDNITRYIVENGFVLIDVTGKPTTWGIWDPSHLNENTDWYDDRGVNSLQILAFLVSAYAITKDSYYLDAYMTLTTKYQYHINIINSKITQHGDINFSDDELMYLPCFTYLFARKYIGDGVLKPDLDPYFDISMARSVAFTKNYRPSPWNAIYYYFKEG